MAEAYLPVDIGDLIPVLARALPDRKYSESRRSVVFSLDGVLVEVFSDRVVLTRVEEGRVREVMDRISRMLVRALQGKDE